MDIIQYPKSVNFDSFAKANHNPDVFYGLPKQVAYCKTCVISNQRPNSAVEYKHTSGL